MSLPEFDSQAAIGLFTEYIKKAAFWQRPNDKVKHVFKKPWFDWQCLKARKKSLRLLNMYRSTDTLFVKRAYLEANHNYKKLVLAKKTQFYSDAVERFKVARGSKEFWEIAKIFKTGINRIVGGISPTQWVNHFESLLCPPVSEHLVYYFAEPLILSSELDTPFTLDELMYVLDKTKCNKAPGVDRVPFEFYKNAPNELLENLLIVFNQIYCGGIVPSAFKKSIIFPLFKKGDPADVTNYRGLSFLNTVGKLFCGLLLERLTSFVNLNSVLSENQAGFRKGYSTVDCIFVLYNMVKIVAKRRGKKLYAFFVDFKAAFDTINRDALFIKLLNAGVSSQFVNVLRNLYTGSTSAVWTPEGTTRSFSVNYGVKQGCPLSPLLFALFINDIISEFNVGVQIGNMLIAILMYADDIVLLAESPGELQQNIEKLQRYCEKWGLTVNLEKSKIMVFRNGGKLRPDERWTFNAHNIDVVGQYKYLGMILTPKLSLQSHLREKSSSAKFALNVVWKNAIVHSMVPLKAKLHIFNSVSRSVLCYAAQVWGSEESVMVERVLWYFIRKLFNLPNFTPSYILHLETGLDPLLLHTLNLNSKYLSNALNMDVVRFPRIIAEEVLKEGVSWAQNWKMLADKHGLPLDFREDRRDMLGFQFKNLILQIKIKFQNNLLDRVNASRRYTLYRLLDHTVRCANMVDKDVDDRKLSDVRWVLRLRGELLNLGHKAYCPDDVHVCTLCPYRDVEDTFHFVAVCPALSSIRLSVLGDRVLSIQDYVNVLNGPDWSPLLQFAVSAWNYRMQIMN